MAQRDAPDPTLYLIDGHAQIFRAYYAIMGGMSSPVTGEPSNATFAFTGMLLKLFSRFHPGYVAMAIDAKGKTFRDELFPEYKANRTAPPDDFAPQIPRILEITRLFGIPVLEKTGQEADDIIATLTGRLLAADDPRDLKLRLVSKDKDLHQLLGDRVTMFDIHTDTTIDVDYLREKLGITPEQVIDYLMLIGDTADNIPGVDKVGPKTAAQLLDTYGSIDGILEHLDQIKGKRRENIAAAAERFELTRKLITLNDQVDIDFTMDDAKVDHIDAAGLERVFKEMGFNRHLADLHKLVGTPIKAPATPATPAGASTGDGDTAFSSSIAEGLFATGDTPDLRADPAPAPAPDAAYTAITTQAQLTELVKTLKAQTLIAVDTETQGLGHHTGLCGVCLSWQEKQGVYIPTRSDFQDQHLDQATVVAALKPVLEDPAVGKCGHNFKYDLLVLRRAGIETRGLVFDSMIGGFLVGAPGVGMDHMALSMLGHTCIPITDLIGEKRRGQPQKSMRQIAIDHITPYAAEDADITLRLTNLIRPRLAEMGMSDLCDEVETPLVGVLADMEDAGIRVDPDVLDQQREALQTRIDALRDQIHEAAGTKFNIDSTKQLREVLFEDMGLPVIKKTKTGPSTDIEVLEKLCDHDELDAAQRRVPALMVEYRQLTKLVSTYLKALKDAIDPADGRVHARFHQTGAATGRLSSSDPNLQNIPIRTEIGRQIRKAFIAEEGHTLVSADYSQIELRMLAHLAEDEALIEAFREGRDIHRAVAAEVFKLDPDDVTPEQRGHAKTINFGIVYGVTPYGLSRRIEGLSLDDAKQLIADYKARFTGIDRFLDQCVAHAVEHGYVRTLMGRRREVPQVYMKNGQQRALGERLAINTVVQGSAADLIKKAMVQLHARIRGENLPITMLLQIHDELVVQTPKDQTEATTAVLRDAMEGAMELNVPLKVETGTGPDWFAAK